MSTGKRFYITTPIYYVNDKPHLGHAYTTLAADVLARFHKARGEDVFFLTGTDEHGAKVAASAEAAGKTPQAFANENSEKFRLAFKTLGIESTDFIRTTEPRHEQAVQAFMAKLREKDVLYEKDYEGLYCTACERFYTEKELVDRHCPIHRRPVERIKERNVFFRLSRYLAEVQKAITSDALQIFPIERKQEALGLIAQGIEDFSVSREKVKWGIPFPGKEGQTMYVWVEALQNYLSALGYPDGAQFKKFWPADVQLMAKDILKFHAIYWPALLMAAGLPLPKTLFIHGFFSIDGEKMSKTTGNVIDPVALVDEFGVDAARYLLLSPFPFGQDGDLKRERFREKYNADLANGLGNLFARVTKMVSQYLGGKVRGTTGDVDSRFQRTKEQTEALDFYGALETTWRIIAEENVAIDRAKPWGLAKDESKKGELAAFLGERIAVLGQLAHVLAPYMPDTAEKILAALSSEGIEKGESLFPRL